jgi:hypothetical protein
MSDFFGGLLWAAGVTVTFFSGLYGVSTIALSLDKGHFNMAVFSLFCGLPFLVGIAMFCVGRGVQSKPASIYTILFDIGGVVAFTSGVSALFIIFTGNSSTNIIAKISFNLILGILFFAGIGMFWVGRKKCQKSATPKQ